ncbi:coatomer subunit delta [Saitoella coloradoensis]
MVVLAASICTRGGKPVISRQFRDMTRTRIEGLLAAFPKLIDASGQHTTVETDNVRYVYQPLDELYMVLITNKQSNILQDIDTLHLFTQVVTSMCRISDEREIARNAFELLSAFDEIVSLGYRENVNLSQVKNFLEMESHEEKIQDIIAKNKEMEATEERKRRAKQLEMQRREAAKAQRQNRASAYGSGGYSSVPSQTYTPEPTYEAPKPQPSYSKPAVSAPKGKGMQLGKKSKQSDVFEATRQEIAVEQAAPLMATPEPTAQPSYLDVAPAQPTDQEPIHTEVTETISAKINHDGGVDSIEIKGDLQLQISAAEMAGLQLQIVGGDREGIQFQQHPNIDKAAFNASHVIIPKDRTKPFPVNRPLKVLRWRVQSTDESLLPLKVNCWPSGGDVTMEYELTSPDATLSNIVIRIPIPSGDATVADCTGSYDFNGAELSWIIPTIDASASSGSMEFQCADDDADIFPVQVEFELSGTVSGVDIGDAELLEQAGVTVPFSKMVRVVAENYNVV